MKKYYLFISALCLLTFSAYAGINKAYTVYLDKEISAIEKMEKITYELMDSKYYFAASIMAGKRLEKSAPLSPRFEDALDQLSIKVGIDYLWSVNIAANHHNSTIGFSLGLKAFREQNYNESQLRLLDVKSEDRYYPEARLMIGTINSLKNDHRKAKENYLICIEAASKAQGKKENEKEKRYYQLLGEDCQINIARDLYRSKKYLQAMSEYNKITKNSYRWPYLLLEKAWVAYQLGDYNRTLGLLVTYKSPLLESYFFPEAEALAALSYFKLCLWNDVAIMINQYYGGYKKEAELLKQFISQNKGKKNFYYELSQSKTVDSSSEYAKKIMVQSKKQIKYSLDILPIQRGENELKFLKKSASNVFTDYLSKKIEVILDEKKSRLDQFLAYNYYDFLNQIHRYSKELFVIQLEMMAQKRTLLYHEEKLISNRSRGDLSNVQREKEQHFWDFSGAFWADELGEYSFGLKSNCERVRK